MPATVFAFHFSFLKTLVVAGSAGVFGSVVSGILIKEIIVLYEWFLNKYFPNRSKKKFSRFNRFIIKAKHHFGIIGIAIIAPLISSIPIGMFFAIRFFGHTKKAILYMSISSVIWVVILYFTYNRFYTTFSHIFK